MKLLLLAAMLVWASDARAQVRPAYMADAGPRIITYAVEDGGAADAILTATVTGVASAALWASVLYNEDGEWTRGEFAAIGFGVGFVAGLVFWAVDDRENEDP